MTFGSHSSEIKKALERSIGLLLPYFTKIDGKTHHRKRYKNYPKLVVLGTLPSPDPNEEKVFRELVFRNSKNAHAPCYAVDVISDKVSIQSMVKGLL